MNEWPTKTSMNQFLKTITTTTSILFFIHSEQTHFENNFPVFMLSPATSLYGLPKPLFLGNK